ncbi:hypothetical protein [Flavobacterium silvaticum]|uniref:Uncharacterized protein n=1 Tax=Flavobacterium silvaticum TaxID=1852020 RepID=A0A972FSP4_9FLAO|nr:hypothetical protein [Flavobacterium silvaticum]NMH26825.1 hypothetical protein [Flavobacterium silvaticum]
MIKQQIGATPVQASNKQRDLYLGLLFDGIGMLSFTIPFIGEFADVVWAPASAFLMAWMYKGNRGKIMGAFSFLEELFPFTDFIPSFTLMWLYTYLIKKQDSR